MGMTLKTYETLKRYSRLFNIDANRIYHKHWVKIMVNGLGIIIVSRVFGFLDDNNNYIDCYGLLISRHNDRTKDYTRFFVPFNCKEDKILKLIYGHDEKFQQRFISSIFN